MPGDRHCLGINTIELKLEIEMRLGRQKTQQYFNLLNKYLSLKISKPDFDNLCIRLLGRESVKLHNRFIRAIIRNAHATKSPLPIYGKGKASLNVEVPSKYRRFGGDLIPLSPTNGRCINQYSPLGPHGKPHRSVSSEHQSATELLSLGSRPPVEVTSVEEGEEIEQLAGSPGIHSRSPLKAPIGVSVSVKGAGEMLSHGSSLHSGYIETCYNNGELPDTTSLRKRLEQKLRMGGLNVSTDCLNLLNNGLDIFMKRLLKPCLDLRSESKARSIANGMRQLTYEQNSSRFFAVSMTDFKVTMEANPQILGENWPLLLEKMLSDAEVVLCGLEVQQILDN